VIILLVTFQQNTICHCDLTFCLEIRLKLLLIFGLTEENYAPWKRQVIIRLRLFPLAKLISAWWPFYPNCGNLIVDSVLSAVLTECWYCRRPGSPSFISAWTRWNYLCNMGNKQGTNLYLIVLLLLLRTYWLFSAMLHTLTNLKCYPFTTNTTTKEQKSIRTSERLSKRRTEKNKKQYVCCTG
jgi:hypothetical protein